MVRLNLNQQPEWYELQPGVELKLAPANSMTLGAAREEPELRKLAEEMQADPDAKHDEMRFTVDLVKALLRRTVLDWKGVEGEDGKKAPLEPQYIDALVDHPVLFQPIMDKYVARFFTLESEKNGSAPSRNGTTAGAPRTAKPARKSAQSARGGKTARKR